MPVTPKTNLKKSTQRPDSVKSADYKPPSKKTKPPKLPKKLTEEEKIKFKLVETLEKERNELKEQLKLAELQPKNKTTKQLSVFPRDNNRKTKKKLNRNLLLYRNWTINKKGVPDIIRRKKLLKPILNKRDIIRTQLKTQLRKNAINMNNPNSSQAYNMESSLNSLYDEFIEIRNQPNQSRRVLLEEEEPNEKGEEPNEKVEESNEKGEESNEEVEESNEEVEESNEKGEESNEEVEESNEEVEEPNEKGEESNEKGEEPPTQPILINPSSSLQKIHVTQENVNNLLESNFNSLSIQDQVNKIKEIIKTTFINDKKDSEIKNLATAIIDPDERSNEDTLQIIEPTLISIKQKLLTLPTNTSNTTFYHDITLLHDLLEKYKNVLEQIKKPSVPKPPAPSPTTQSPLASKPPAPSPIESHRISNNYSNGLSRLFTENKPPPAPESENVSLQHNENSNIPPFFINLTDDDELMKIWNKLDKTLGIISEDPNSSDVDMSTLIKQIKQITTYALSTNKK
jgi:hypothetical protein